MAPSRMAWLGWLWFSAVSARTSTGRVRAASALLAVHSGSRADDSCAQRSAGQEKKNYGPVGAGGGRSGRSEGLWAGFGPELDPKPQAPSQALRNNPKPATKTEPKSPRL